MPVQLVFAGKAHPHDGPGKTVLQEIARLTRDPRFAGKIVFIEDYDINVGRHLVQGVDVWLNNPRRPLEACGTSGQKVVLNGALESVGARRLVGGGLRRPQRLRDRQRRDALVDRRRTTHATPDALATVLRDEVVPLYYDRDRDGLPREWIARDEAGDPHARLALQRRPDGDGLRAEGVHSGGRRHEQRRPRRVYVGPRGGRLQAALPPIARRAPTRSR